MQPVLTQSGLFNHKIANSSKLKSSLIKSPSKHLQHFEKKISNLINLTKNYDDSSHTSNYILNHTSSYTSITRYQKKQTIIKQKLAAKELLYQNPLPHLNLKKNQCRLHWQWFRAGALIWPLANILRLNVTGVDSICVAIVKQFSNIVISPFAGAYADIAVGMWMQLTVDEMPELAPEIKNSLSYKELGVAYRKMIKNIKNTQEDKEKLKKQLADLKLEFKRQNAYLKIYLSPNFRSVVSVVATVVLGALVFSTGGLALLPALLSIPAVYGLRALASGFDNLFKLKLTEQANLKYSDAALAAKSSGAFNFKPASNSEKSNDKKNLKDNYINRYQIRQQTILMILHYRSAKRQYRLDQINHQLKNFNKRIIKRNHLKKLTKLYYQQKKHQQKIENLMQQYDAIHALNFKSLPNRSIAARCLLSDFYLCTQSIRAAWAQTNAVRQQIIKNLGAVHQGAFLGNPIAMSLAADILRYGPEIEHLGGLSNLALNNTDQSVIFGSLKGLGNIISAFGRNLSSGSRQMVKKIFANASSTDSKNNKKNKNNKNNKINWSASLTTPAGQALNLNDYQLYYRQKISRWQLFKITAKSVFLSAMAIFLIPYHYLTAKYAQKYAERKVYLFLKNML